MHDLPSSHPKQFMSQVRSSGQLYVCDTDPQSHVIGSHLGSGLVMGPHPVRSAPQQGAGVKIYPVIHVIYNIICIMHMIKYCGVCNIQGGPKKNNTETNQNDRH